MKPVLNLTNTYLYAYILHKCSQNNVSCMTTVLYTGKVSKNGVVYYIRIPPETPNITFGDIVLIKIFLSNGLYIPLVRRVSKLGKYKIVTLPRALYKVWKLLHGHTMTITLEKVANPAQIAKELMLEKIVFDLHSEAST